MTLTPPSEESAAGLADHTSPPEAALCFVGSALLFPDAVLRAVQRELPAIQPVRAPGLVELMTLASPPPRICALVVDELNAAALMRARQDGHPLPEGAHLVIAYRNPAFAEEMIAAQGAAILKLAVSLLPMDLNLETWLAVLRMVLSGGHYIPPEVMTRRAPPPEPDPAERFGLTPRELEVLKMLSSGKANKLIAARLDLSEHTVKLHIHRIIAKLGVTNRTEAALTFHRAHH